MPDQQIEADLEARFYLCGSPLVRVDFAGGLLSSADSFDSGDQVRVKAKRKVGAGDGCERVCVDYRVAGQGARGG